MRIGPMAVILGGGLAYLLMSKKASASSSTSTGSNSNGAKVYVGTVDNMVIQNTLSRILGEMKIPAEWRSGPMVAFPYPHPTYQLWVDQAYVDMAKQAIVAANQVVSIFN